MQAARTLTGRPEAFDGFSEDVDHTGLTVDLRTAVGREQDGRRTESVERGLDDRSGLAVASGKRCAPEGVRALCETFVVGTRTFNTLVSTFLEYVCPETG